VPSSEPGREEIDFGAFARSCRACRVCFEAGLIPAARPVFAGSPAAPLLLIGQAPGPVEHASGAPFSGRSGRELWRWMARAGFSSEAEFRSLCYITAMMRCFPGRLASGAGDRRPPSAAVANCSSWLSVELRLLHPVAVVLVGQLAISAFLGRGPLANLVGRSFAGRSLPAAERAPALREAEVIPLPHPSGQSRWLNSPANRERLGRALEQLGRLRASGRLSPDVIGRAG
jgi:uracil-DNA glycosylase